MHRPVVSHTDVRPIGKVMNVLLNLTLIMYQNYLQVHEKGKRRDEDGMVPFSIPEFWLSLNFLLLTLADRKNKLGAEDTEENSGKFSD